MDKFLRDPSFDRLMNSTRPIPGVEIDLVDDYMLAANIYLDVRPQRVDQAAWIVALGVDDIASWLDFYKFTFFKTFDVQFYAAREMLSARKLRDRNTTPRR